MKKRILLIFLTLLLCSCNKQENNDIETIIEKNNRYYISINYPITHISKIDQPLKKEVNKILTNFKKEYTKKIYLNQKAELNIDYTISTSNKYISIILNSFLNAPNLAHPIHDIYTINYDIKKKKIITLKNIVPKNTLEKKLPILKIQLLKKYSTQLFLDTLDQNFTIDTILNANFFIQENTITLYFPPYTLAPYSYGILTIAIPLNQINQNITIRKETNKEVISYPIKNKPLDPRKPTVALTFDDGPSKYTEEILNILKNNNMNATFFILGNKVETYQELLKKSIQNGNELGNHSYNHKCLTKLKSEEQIEQLTKTTNIIKETLNYNVTLFRPTYGSFNQTLKENTKLEMTLWTVDTKDWKYKNSKTITTKALKDIKDESIILMHDTHKQTINALKEIIKELKEKGYQVVTVSELQTIKKLRNEK